MILRDQNNESSTYYTIQFALILFLIFMLLLFLLWCYFLFNWLRNCLHHSPIKKGSNSVCRFLFESAEHSVNKAAQLAEPVTNIFEKPIKFADSTFCTTMDIVGTTIQKGVETPQKICSKAINSVPVQPAVDCVKTVSSYGVQTVSHLYNKVHGTSTTPSAETPTTQDESEIETEPEKYDQSTQTALAVGNVKDKAKMFS